MGQPALILGGSGNTPLTSYSDSNGMSHPDHHPIAGYVYLIGGAISWSSKRQDLVCLSTTEAEYVALSHAVKEAIWLRNLLNELFPLKVPPPITVHRDNQGAIALSKDDRFHARTKHIDIRFHFVREAVENGQVHVVYCATDDMVADTLTKALPGPKAHQFAAAMGLAPYKSL